MIKRILKWLGIGLGCALVVVVGFVGVEVHAFDASLAKVYDVPVPNIVVPRNDAAAIARGKHLAESLGACATHDCHGADLTGGRTIDMGPVATLTGPNLTQIVPAYSDGEIARLMRYGIRKGGTGLRFMPAGDSAWWPDSDVAALIAYLRTLPLTPKANGPVRIKPLGKVLDRLDLVPLDPARRLVGKPVDTAPPPTPTKEYGAYVIRLCKGCHGEGLGGGRIPGSPPSLPVPPNITPDPSGLGPNYTYEQFQTLLTKGIKRDGKPLDPFMPVDALSHLDDTEMRALYEAMRALPPKPFGTR